ncbi:hypothetical protein [Streptomyces sp. WAC 01325]|uniref:hypothetical protein n=1 Tax=Streptomyces sp. WAC 01325 TaxID=2203202 RepID=UPI00163B84D8|nr:hypothetical protein [Streptomyces sp. WAC 01325]
MQSLREQHRHPGDAVRALRRPASWRADRKRVRRWVRSILTDPRLVVLGVQTTSLSDPWVVQGGLTGRHGNVLCDE